LISTAVLAAVLIVFHAPPSQAQFTPRFSTQKRGTEGQLHIGIGATVVDLGEYTSDPWPELGASPPILHGRIGAAIPLGGENYFIAIEVEGNTTNAEGRYVESVALRSYDVPEITQTGFSIMANLLRMSAGRKTIFGGGIGYHLIKHDPILPPQMNVDGVRFLRDPFIHIGMGLQGHVARSIATLNEKTQLMVEGRYKVAWLGGNVPGAEGRKILMSEFQITTYLAIK
jgi:hypothetical protein